jgi:hypothetical protein
MRGEKSEVGATRVSANGYHYTKLDSGWQLTHRVVVEEQVLGRALQDDERVRFEDGDRTNLDPKNLAVYRVRQTSKERRRAQLLARRQEIDAELADLDNA